MLSKIGWSMLQLEVPLHALKVTFQAMTHCRHTWPLITEDMQEGCLHRLTATMKFTEGLPHELAARVMRFTEETVGQFLLA